MPDPEHVARVRQYLEQHRQTYDKDALRQKLLTDGHDAEVVELAIAQTYGFEVPGPTPPVPAAGSTSNTRFALALAGTFLFNYVLLPVLVVLLVNLATGSSAGFFLGFSLVPLALVVEAIAAFVLRQRDPAVSRGLRWGIAVSLFPIAALILLFGICVAVLRFA